MSEVSEHLPSNEKIANLLSEEKNQPFMEFLAHHEITLWGLLLMLAEVSSAYYVLIDKLQELDVLGEDDLKEINSALSNPEYLQSLYAHMANAFHDKCERIKFSAENPEKVAAYVEEKHAGKNPVDPMEVIGEDD